MVAAGCLAALALAGVGAQGYRLEAEPGAGVTGHILVGLAAVLVLLLAHSWVLFYLLGAERVLREVPNEIDREVDRGVDREAPREQTTGPALTAFRRRVLPPLLGAAGAALATFVLGIAAYAGRTPAILHGALFWATLAFQAWAAAAEWRALVAAEETAASLRAA